MSKTRWDAHGSPSSIWSPAWVAAVAQSAIDPISHVPMVGASGAIAGVLGAYLLLYPRANVRVLMVLFIYIRIINVPAVYMLGAWFLLQLISASVRRAVSSGVAFWAHVGGFLCGCFLLPCSSKAASPCSARHARGFRDIRPAHPRHRADSR